MCCSLQLLLDYYITWWVFKKIVTNSWITNAVYHIKYVLGETAQPNSYIRCTALYGRLLRFEKIKRLSVLYGLKNTVERLQCINWRWHRIAVECGGMAMPKSIGIAPHSTPNQLTHFCIFATYNVSIICMSRHIFFTFGTNASFAALTNDHVVWVRTKCLRKCFMLTY